MATNVLKPGRSMCRIGPILCLAVAAVAHGATLQRLSLDDMIVKSTSIVHGQVTESHAAASGRIIYTHYTLAVTDSLKGSTARQIDVAVPGGTAGGFQQIFPGAPALSLGQDYVLFLWTGPSGLTQIIGLSQGLFSVVPDQQGQPMATRAASHELMLDKAGKRVEDQTLEMSLAALKGRVRLTLSGGAKQ